MSLVNDAALNIDKYADLPNIQTGDVAEFNGHLYCDKAIGVSLLATLPLGILRACEQIHQTRLSVFALRYWSTLCVSGLCATLTGMLLFLILKRMSARPDDPATLLGAYIIAVSTLLGTQLFFHATLLLPYAPAALFLTASLFVLQRMATDEQAATILRAFLCGLAAGFCVLCETLWGVAAVTVLALAAWQTRRHAVRLWPALLAGFLLGILPFAVYCYSIFGSLSIPYIYERDATFREGMASGFMGAHLPNMIVLYYLTFSPFKGLFWQSPFLIIALPGFIILWRQKHLRHFATAFAGVALFYLLFNSGYFMWWGGWSFAPRHLAMLSILLAFPLMAAWNHGNMFKALILFLLIPALIMHLTVVCVDPQIPDATATRTTEMMFHPTSIFTLTGDWKARVLPLFLDGKTPACYLGRNATVAVILMLWAVLTTFVFLLTRNTTLLCKNNYNQQESCSDHHEQ